VVVAEAWVPTTPVEQIVALRALTREQELADEAIHELEAEVAKLVAKTSLTVP
jgi:hypothetical protein